MNGVRHGIDEAGRPRPVGSLWLSVSLRSAADCGHAEARRGGRRRRVESGGTLKGGMAHGRHGG
jgi:hypothetical protein